ncbi:MAG: fimbrillin family protein [Tidjanibacter sp.]|nr:fimbrillin family protein [Tidjanibacter sp.]
MKKLFAIAAVVAVALTSCVENEVVTPAGEIAFKDFTLSSKALILPGSTAEEALPTTCAFGAYALYQGLYESVNDEHAVDADYTTDDAIYVDGLEVKHDGSQWAYDVAQYWPTDTNDLLDFYAYYPFNASVASWDTTNNCVALTAAQLGTTLNDQTDWMVTTPVLGKNSDNAATGVGIVFKHITSMVVFKAIDVTPEARYQNLITIKSIEVKQAAYAGNYTAATWTADGASRADVVVYNDAIAVPTAAAADVTTATVDGGAVIVVPETMQDATEFVVTYDLKESADHVIAAETGVTATIKVKDLTAAWQAGKKYVYTINFDLIGGGVGGDDELLKEITFVPTVSPWEEVVGGAPAI